MADDRGDLIIRRRVYERLAERAALAIDGVVVQTTGLTSAFDGQVSGSAAMYRRLPHATTRDDGATISVSVAVRWPARLNDVCRRVREQVAGDVLRFTGAGPQSVDVEVAQLVSGDTGGANGGHPAATRPAPRRRSGFIDLPPVGESAEADTSRLVGS